MGPWCSGLLSFHRWWRAVIAALLNQPHAVSATSGPGNGQASKGTTTAQAQIRTKPIHTTLMPPLGLQARATELSESMLRRGTFKLVSLSLEWRGGTKQRNRRLVSGSEAASFFFSSGPCRQKSVAGDCIDGLVSVLRSSFLSCVGVF